MWNFEIFVEYSIYTCESIFIYDEGNDSFFFERERGFLVSFAFDRERERERFAIPTNRIREEEAH